MTGTTDKSKVRVLFSQQMLLIYPLVFMAHAGVVSQYTSHDPIVSLLAGIGSVLLFMAGRLVDPGKLPLGGSNTE